MNRSRGENASVLVGLLWCLALLSVLVIGVLHTSRLDLLVVKNHGDSIQAHYLALAGIEKAKALLYQDAAARKKAAKNHSGELYDSTKDFRDVPLGRGLFRIVRQGRVDEGSKLIYGVSDEESRLNVNTATIDQLIKTYGMLPEIAAAIIDWRDSDSNVTPNGAEAEYYSALRPPYLPRNGPFETLRELLMVRGVTRELFMGEDINQNGLLDPNEDDGSTSLPSDNHDGILDAGWSGILTVNSQVRNRTASGLERVDLQTADEAALTGVKGITSDIAKAIIARRGQNKFESLADLLEVSAPQPQQPPPQQQNLQGNLPNQQSGQPQDAAQAQAAQLQQNSGPKLIDENLLIDIADDVTTISASTLAGAINVNTASVDVLACLPAITPELAQAIVSYRQSAGYLPNVAWLLKVDGITRDIFKQIAPKVTVRSETFRILSEGQVTSTGAKKRIMAIVRIGASDIETLSYREDL
ncbi:MAG: comEA protein [Verrucomicrobiales bacterium]|nr:comEA protein [Verrucomicrobiales bacterium]